ncbi:uncharacterized protein NPIL_604531 [Nephila pilipes]|uniref:Monocarboxylate transporter n=1 Tax=Nephila pilipes TaxID=299642 RepID=A0A8X6M764_NEPPI|nr:uncharacterized protein NPIL_604531 [Nephila pilipes]
MPASGNNWSIPVVCGLLYSLNLGYARLGGLFYVATMNRYNVPRNQASRPYFLTYLMKCLLSPLVGYLGRKYGECLITTMGAILSALGIGVCFLVEEIGLLTFLWGGIFGLGSSMSTSLLAKIISDHIDDKNLAKATGISLGGTGIVAFLLLYLSDILLEKYSLSGTFLILSAIILNGVPLGMYLIYSDPKRNSKIVQEMKNKTLFSNVSSVTDKIIEPTEQDHNFPNSARKSTNYIELSDLEEIEHSKTEFSSSTSQKQNSALKSNQDDYKTRNPSSEDKQLYKGFRFEPREKNAVPLLSKITEKSFTTPISKRDSMLQNFISYFRVFWNPAYCLMLVTQSCYFFTMATVLTIIADFSLDKGTASNIVIYVLICLQVTDTIGRFGLGWVTDGGYLSNINFNALCFSSLGISSVTLVFATSFNELMTAIAIFGIICGGTTIVFPGIICQFIEEDQVTMALSARFFLTGPMFLTSSPMIRIFREKMGSYDGIMYLMAILSFLCCILTLLIPYVARSKMKTSL